MNGNVWYDLYWVCRQSQQFFSFPYSPIHIIISASTGHPHVQYTQPFLDAITPTLDPFLGYTVHIYISVASYLKFEVNMLIMY
jgi:hypothetical protein